MKDEEAVMTRTRRVRHDMADSVLVMVFSLAASTAIAVAVAFTTRLL